LFINVVYSLFEDRNGKIWCGTWGIDVFDPLRGTFNHIPAFEGSNSINAGEVSAILEDKDGIMLLNRQNRTRQQIVDDLFNMLLDVVTMKRSVRVPKKAEAKE